MRTLRWFGLVVVVLMSACVFNREMSAAGKSAQGAFQDARVVALLQAARDGDMAKARSLVAQGANVNASGYEGVTPLLWMLYQRDDKAIALLLDLGANPNQPMGKGGETPVWFAAGGGHLRALTLLLDHGGDPNSSANEESALMIAIEDSHMDCADLLLRRGANINWHQNFSCAVKAPMLHNRFDEVIWLLDHGYTYNLVSARRLVMKSVPSKNQEVWKAKALEALDKRISEQAASPR